MNTQFFYYSTIREEIEQKAKAVSCLWDVYNLSDLDAIRFIQQKEGYTPCFGRNNPLYPSENKKKCSNSTCYWHRTCDSYRNEKITPIDKALNLRTKADLDTFINNLRKFRDRKATFLMNNEVELKCRSFNNINNLIRKMLVISPKTVVTECSDNIKNLKCYSLGINRKWGWGFRSVNVYNDIELLFTSDLFKLNKFLKDTEVFINKGNLNYYPLMKNINHVERDIWPYFQGAFYTFPTDLDFNLSNTSHIALTDDDILLSNPNYIPLLNIEIPYLENVDCYTLSKLMSEYPQELFAFQDFFHSKMEGIRNLVQNSSNFASDCRRVEGEINEHLRKLNSDYKKTKLKTIIDVVEGTVTFFVLSIFCFYSKNNILSLIGPGGAFVKLADTIKNSSKNYFIEMNELKNDSVFLIWKIGRTKRKI
ncbi:hypothetical protein CPJCM30710_25120 [Clostridium polyendosporum]|uniref:Uncharacterized protein n=1 Tax=Clostridium polyendosporum TaxID=69208 RepID=A0A919S1Y6_9CLOT|nr:hypothetical protein [Clostridium polyendosporum]GIM29846.1 hypothetical protein CPJCM30710_25120 [Clostridium polyendosporum]